MRACLVGSLQGRGSSRAERPSPADLIALYPPSSLLRGGGPEHFDVGRRQTSGKEVGRWFGGFCRGGWKRVVLNQLLLDGLLDAQTRAENPWLQSRPRGWFPEEELRGTAGTAGGGGSDADAGARPRVVRWG